MSALAGICKHCGRPRDDCTQVGHVFAPDDGVTPIATANGARPTTLPDGTPLAPDDWCVFLYNDATPYVIVRPTGEVLMRTQMTRDDLKAIFRDLRKFFV